MRAYIEAAFDLAVELRIPMRGYESLLVNAAFSCPFVTNPHAGL